MRPRRWLTVLLTVVVSVPTVSAQPETIPLRLENRFPPADSVGSDYHLGGITDFELLDDGRIAVLDAGQSVLLILHETGDLIRRVGRRGNAPGEFFWPSDVEYDKSSGLIWVRENRRLQAFSRNYFAFSHEFYSSEVWPRYMVAEGGELYLGDSAAPATDLAHRYSVQGTYLGTVGTHLEREVGDYGRNIHKAGDLTASFSSDGTLTLCYAYSQFNDILVISRDGQRVMHSDYPVVVEQDAKNQGRARSWPYPDQGSAPWVLVGNPYLVGDRLFLRLSIGTWQEDVPILEMDLNGLVHRVWTIPTEYGFYFSFAVQLEGDEPVFWVAWGHPDPHIAKLVRAR